MLRLPVVAIVVVVVVGGALACGCDRSDRSATPAATTPPPATAAVLPVIVVDQRHTVSSQGSYKPYVLEACRGVVLDGTRFGFRDPGNLARMPNSVHLISDNRTLHVATWPTRGTQRLTLDSSSLEARKGGQFAGFSAGGQAYVAIGYEEPSDKPGEFTFVPFWIGSLVFR